MARFEKGHPGGPGRPRKTEQQIRFEQRCRDWSDLNAFNYLAKHADSTDKDVFKWAVGELLNRGFGKPVETQVIDAEITGPTGISVEELARAAAELIGGGEGKGGGMDSPGKVDG